MNAIALMGTLQSEPELRFTQDGLACLSVIVSFSAGRLEEADYQIRAIAFGNLAEEVSKNFHHGDGVIIEGRLQAETRNKPDGTKGKVTELVARRIYAGATGASVGSASPAPVAVTNGTPAAARPASRPAQRPPVVAEPDNDDIPF